MSNQPIKEPGYDQEEEYFKRRDLELLNKRRAELDAARKRQAAEQAHGPHWMKCPKCSSDLQEITHQHVKLERCPKCGGVFLDAGELDLLLHRKPVGFVESMLALFK